MGAGVQRAFLTGVIEGFYGRPWPSETRLAYPNYLQAMGLNTYLYCPKADTHLRRHWQQDWPVAQWRRLQAVGRACAGAGVFWGPGLSPYALYRDYGPARRRELRDKIERLKSLEAPLLAVLFDDMPGDLDALAARQADIVADVAGWLPGVRLLVCPTYYSFDPVLERVFGRMPENYWAELGGALPPGVDVFWTGNRVCSDSIQPADLESIEGLLGRPPLLWDNYPVNDGATRSNFLYCRPLGDRGPGLRPFLTGHLCNGMNQGLLSLPALAGLSALYGCRVVPDSWLARALGERTWTCLQRDRDRFQCMGLTGLDESERAGLAAEYDAIGEPGAVEVAGWLRGDYAFDPACLTD